MKKREISRFSTDEAETYITGSGDAARGAAIIRAGGIVAIPTETSYGLAVEPFNDTALDRLFILKKRPPSKPVLVLIDSLERLKYLVTEIPEVYEPLIRSFWPGPLTLIFPALPTLPQLVTAGTGTIGVRVSSHRLATGICQRAGGAITATSANISGTQPARNSQQIQMMFDNRVDMIVDGGTLNQTPPSTVITELNGSLKPIREGVVPLALIEQMVGSIIW